jgi:hypothetical protein
VTLEPVRPAERLITVSLSSIGFVKWAIRVVAVVTMVLGVWISALAGDAPASATDEPSAVPNLSEFTCALPPLPHGVPHAPANSLKLSGPAVSALQGGAARHGFTLDGGDLVVTPPRPGDVPLLSAQQALCGAMASTGGMSPLPAAQGVAVGLARVSVAQKFFPAITSFPYPGIVAAQNPWVASFHDRLAWLVVVHAPPPAFNCPWERHPVRLVTRASDHGYEVFMIDARTGSDALIYWESGPGGCTSGARVPAHVGVAEERVSVPWTLVSRDPDGYSGTVAATAFACDKVPNPVLVDRAGPNVAVVVTRPFGQCGAPESIPIGLDAAVVTANLPGVIGHDPTGLLTGFSPQPSTPPGAPSTTTTTTTTLPPPLVPADISESGQTLDVTVGEVVTVNPLPGALGNPAVSSDPAVLGPLTSDPQPLVAEFRAWNPGTADITVPQSACVHPDSDQLPCTGPFVVHVVVR